KTFTTLKNLFANLSNNVSTSNDTLGGQLISDQHRYLIQKWFDNERTYTTLTVGPQDLTFTGNPASGAVSGTLTAPWAYDTGTQLAVFANSEQRTILLTKGSTAVTWQAPLTSACSDASL